MMKQIEVVAAIIRKDDKIFATQRGYGEWKDWWRRNQFLSTRTADAHPVIWFLGEHYQKCV